MNWRQTRNQDDRDLWKWERMKEAEHMAQVYRSDPVVSAGWTKEAERYRRMTRPKDRP